MKEQPIPLSPEQHLGSWHDRSFRLITQYEANPNRLARIVANMIEEIDRTLLQAPKPARPAVMEIKHIWSYMADMYSEY